MTEKRKGSLKCHPCNSSYTLCLQFTETAGDTGEAESLGGKQSVAKDAWDERDSNTHYCLGVLSNRIKRRQMKCRRQFIHSFRINPSSQSATPPARFPGPLRADLPEAERGNPAPTDRHQRARARQTGRASSLHATRS